MCDLHRTDPDVIARLRGMADALFPERSPKAALYDQDADDSFPSPSATPGTSTSWTTPGFDEQF